MIGCCFPVLQLVCSCLELRPDMVTAPSGDVHLPRYFPPISPATRILTLSRDLGVSDSTPSATHCVSIVTSSFVCRAIVSLESSSLQNMAAKTRDIEGMMLTCANK